MASKELIETAQLIEAKAKDGIMQLDDINLLREVARISINDEKDVGFGLQLCAKCKAYVERLVQSQGLTLRQVDDYRITEQIQIPEMSVYWDAVLEETPYLFESFMFYMEKDRVFEKKFYAPRQYTKQGKPALKIVATELQNLAGRKYRKLAISMPSRVGKSTIFIFFLCWNALRYPNSHSAYGGYSGVLAKGFYKEIMNLMTSPEYTYAKIYSHMHPNYTMICDKSAEDFTVTLGDPDRFPTICCRGIDGSWTGIVDVSSNGILAVDDLIRDREHSMSPTRMENTFQEYLNKMVDRMNVGAVEVLIGTLWGVLDPIMRLKRMYDGDPTCKFIAIPALDENDESNFDYIVNGFTTEYYKEMRERLDPAEWCAKFQQKPFVREGLLFEPEDLIYFDGIIRRDEIRRVVAVCDPSFGGGDNLSMPICIEGFTGRKTIVAWVYDKGTLKKTIPRIVSAIQKYGISELQIEKSGAGMMLGDEIKKAMAEQGVISCKIIEKYAPNKISKEDKIIGYSDYIKANFEFLPPNRNIEVETNSEIIVFRRDADYNRAMDDTSMYVSEGKNPHDDAPDSLAQLAIFYESKRNGQIEVLHLSGLGF